MEIRPAGELLARLMDDALAAVAPDMCIEPEDVVDPDEAPGAAGLADALITISGPPATSAMLSSTAIAPPVAAGAP
jgi:hypothetical protein